MPASQCRGVRHPATRLRAPPSSGSDRRSRPAMRACRGALGRLRAPRLPAHAASIDPRTTPAFDRTPKCEPRSQRLRSTRPIGSAAGDRRALYRDRCSAALPIEPSSLRQAPPESRGAPPCGPPCGGATALGRGAAPCGPPLRGQRRAMRKASRSRMAGRYPGMPAGKTLKLADVQILFPCDRSDRATTRRSSAVAGGCDHGSQPVGELPALNLEPMLRERLRDSRERSRRTPPTLGWWLGALLG